MTQYQLQKLYSVESIPNDDDDDNDDCELGKKLQKAVVVCELRICSSGLFQDITEFVWVAEKKTRNLTDLFSS
jgi:hypothetical protein